MSHTAQSWTCPACVANKKQNFIAHLSTNGLYTSVVHLQFALQCRKMLEMLEKQLLMHNYLPWVRFSNTKSRCTSFVEQPVGMLSPWKARWLAKASREWDRLFFIFFKAWKWRRCRSVVFAQTTLQYTEMLLWNICCLPSFRLLARPQRSLRPRCCTGSLCHMVWGC